MAGVIAPLAAAPACGAAASDAAARPTPSKAATGRVRDRWRTWLIMPTSLLWIGRFVPSSAPQAAAPGRTLLRAGHFRQAGQNKRLSPLRPRDVEPLRAHPRHHVLRARAASRVRAGRRARLLARVLRRSRRAARPDRRRPGDRDLQRV